MNKYVIFLLILTLFDPYFSLAGQALDSQYGNWAVFTSKYKNKTICYIVGEVHIESGEIGNRNNPYITVTQFHKDAEPEFSVSSGYTYKKNSTTLIIDKKNKFALSTKGKMAWPSNLNDDKKIIQLMQKGKTLEVIGNNAKNQMSLDSYSLSGFQKAHRRMKQKCL